MARFTTLGLVFVLAAASMAVLASTGVVEVVSAVVLGGLCLVFSIPCFIIGRMGASMDRDVARVRELDSLGVRRTGRVLDAIPYTSEHGGAVLHPNGAQMVLSVELDRGAEGKKHVTLHVVEPSDAARARIGTEVTVIEHPDDPAIRALEGFMPNGIRG